MKKQLGYLAKLQRHLNSVKTANQIPWKVKYRETVGGSPFPDGIISRDGKPVVDGGFIQPHATAVAEFTAKAPHHIEVLLRALTKACGYDNEKVEFLLMHSYKEFLEDAGIIEESVVLREDVT